MLARPGLCLFMSPLRYGASAVIVLTVIPKDSAISMNFELANPLLLSVKYFLEAP